MAIERSRRTDSLVDVLDRVLDKGVVIEGSARARVGIDLTLGDCVVASVDPTREPGGPPRQVDSGGPRRELPR